MADATPEVIAARKAICDHCPLKSVQPIVGTEKCLELPPVAWGNLLDPLRKKAESVCPEGKW